MGPDGMRSAAEAAEELLGLVVAAGSLSALADGPGTFRYSDLAGRARELAEGAALPAGDRIAIANGLMPRGAACALLARIGIASELAGERDVAAARLLDAAGGDVLPGDARDMARRAGEAAEALRALPAR